MSMLNGSCEEGVEDVEDAENQSKRSISSPTTTKTTKKARKAKTTKPKCLSDVYGDGTLYRFITTLFLPQIRSHIVTLGNDIDKSTMDDKKSSIYHRVFVHVQPVYSNKNDLNLASVNWKNYEFYAIHGVNKNVSSEYDELSVEDCVKLLALWDV